MAYRKTEKVLAKLEARRHSIMACAIDVLSKSGMGGLTTDAVAERAGIAVGLIYKYFPDKTELLAAVVAQLLARDIAAVREASIAEKDNPLHALAAGITVLYHRMDNPRLVKAMVAQPAYRLGIRTELERLIRAAMTDLSAKDRLLASAAALGAIYGLYDVSDGSKNRASAAVAFVLRGIGVTDDVSGNIIARRYSLATA